MTANSNNRGAGGATGASNGAGGGAGGGMRTRNKANSRQTMNGLPSVANPPQQQQAPPPQSDPISNGSENIPPQRGNIDKDTVGKAAAAGVSK